MKDTGMKRASLKMCVDLDLIKNVRQLKMTNASNWPNMIIRVEEVSFMAGPKTNGACIFTIHI